MLARLPFRSKLILVVSVPIAVMLVLAGSVIARRFDALAVARDYDQVVVPFRDLTALARAASDEGVASEAFVRDRATDPAGATKALRAVRDRTDQAVGALEASVSSLDGRVSPATAAKVGDLATDTGTLLEEIRGAVDRGSSWIGYYDPLVRSSLDGAQDVVRDLADPDLTTALGAVLDVGRQQAAIGNQAAILLYAIRYSENGVVNASLAETLGPDRVAALVDERAAKARFAAAAIPAQRAALVATESAAPGPSPIAAFDADGGLPTTITASPAEYDDWYRKEQARLDTGAAGALAAVDRAAAERQDQIRRDTIVVALGTAAAVLVALLLSYALVRAVNRPLRALTRAARDMSERRLPRLVDTLRRGGELTPDQLEELTPIRVDSDDEIGELAKAFSMIQDVTFTVAQEQSELLRKGIGDLYVNLARRNQSLLDRQILMLDEMEGRVDDARELASLFELDHLATRMRRNAESLLVLSGAEQPRQWGSAIPAIDVVRAAAAEIADFARVTYFGFEDDIAVAGNAVADVTHIIAELLENAAAFSPPSTPVVVAGRRVERRFVITVTDEGIGMEEERVAAANALLVRPPAPGLALSRSLGLYVVAHLAARYGIRVQLRRGPGTGITAIISLPATVLARPDAPAPDSTMPRRGVAVPGEVAPTPSTAGSEARPPQSAVPEPVLATTASTPVAATSDTSLADAPPVPPIAWSGARPASAAAPTPTGEPTGQSPLTRRATQTNGSDGHATPNGLRARIPGTHLSDRPAPDVPLGPPDVRPRPERVHDLLTRHERGKSDGRVRAPETPANAEYLNEEQT